LGQDGGLHNGKKEKYQQQKNFVRREVREIGKQACLHRGGEIQGKRTPEGKRVPSQIFDGATWGVRRTAGDGGREEPWALPLILNIEVEKNHWSRKSALQEGVTKKLSVGEWRERKKEGRFARPKKKKLPPPQTNPRARERAEFSQGEGKENVTFSEKKRDGKKKKGP